jgi:hypothetical protein
VDREVRDVVHHISSADAQVILPSLDDPEWFRIRCANQWRHGHQPHFKIIFSHGCLATARDAWACGVVLAKTFLGYIYRAYRIIVQRALSGSQRHDGIGHERKPRSSSSTGVQGMVSSRVAAVGQDRRSRPFLHVTVELNECII